MFSKAFWKYFVVLFYSPFIIETTNLVKMLKIIPRLERFSDKNKEKKKRKKLSNTVKLLLPKMLPQYN